VSCDLIKREEPVGYSFLERWGWERVQQTIWDWEKTISSSPFCSTKEQEELEQPTLLVCPTSVLGNWGESQEIWPDAESLDAPR